MYQYALYCMSVLVNSTSLDQVEKCLFCIKILVCSPHIDERVIDSHNSLCNMIGSLGCLDDSDSIVNDVLKSDVTSKDDNEDEEDCTEDEEVYVKQLMKKPFGTYFVERLRKVQISEKIDDDGDVNPFYQPKFMSVLETKWIPTLSIWTSLMRGYYCKLGKLCFV